MAEKNSPKRPRKAGPRGARKTKRSEETIEHPDYPLIPVKDGEQDGSNFGSGVLKFLWFLVALDVLAMIFVWIISKLGI